MLEINNTTRQKIKTKPLEKLVEGWLKDNKKVNWTVSLALIASKRMRSLNRDYRGLDKTTDVLSFAATSNNLSDKYLGEIIINLDEVKKPRKYIDVLGAKKSSDYILKFLLIHGLLHLIGYNDEKETDRQAMLKLGEKFLEKFSG